MKNNLFKIFAIVITIAVMGRMVEVKGADKLNESHLVGYWPFNEGKGGTAQEITGNANAGKISGATWVKDGDRSTLRFDGEDDTVDCGRSPAYEQEQAITVLLWMKPLQAISRMEALAGRAWCNPYAIYTRKDNSLEASILINVRRGGEEDWHYVYATRKDVLKVGEWNFIGFSYGVTDNALRLFHNGEKVGEEVVKSKKPAKDEPDRKEYKLFGPSNQPLSIGYFHGRAHFQGLIRQVGIYDRALNEKEVEKIYEKVLVEGALLDPGRPYALVQAQPTIGAAPLTVAFDGSGSSDTDGTIASYQWDFGDGSTAGGLKTSHIYRRPGEYQVRLVVTDNDGKTASRSNVYITVNPSPPTARISAKPASGSAPLTVNFDGSGSIPPYGKIVTYCWDFDDDNGDIVPLVGTLDGDDEKVEFPAPEIGRFSISYDIVFKCTTDICVGLQSKENTGTDWQAYSYLVNTGGDIFKVRDDDEYRYNAEVKYEVGKAYRIRMEVNVPAKKYDVYVSADGVTTQIADDYNIRDTAADATNIARLACVSLPKYNGTAAVSSIVLKRFGALGPQVTHKYAKPGKYKVRLTVVNEDGMTDTETGIITVTQAP